MVLAINRNLSLDDYYPSDRENMVQFLNDRTIYHNTLRIPYPYTAEDAEEFIARAQVRNRDYGPVDLVIRHREAGLIGGLGRFLDSGLEGHTDEIGYWLAAAYRGQGLMSAVVLAYTNYLFATTPLVRITAQVFTHNLASARVLEKSGFQLEGELRLAHCKNGQYFNSWLYAKIKVS